MDFELWLCCTPLAVIAQSLPLLAPEVSRVRRRLSKTKLGAAQKGFDGFTSEGYKDQGEVPLRENPRSP